VTFLGSRAATAGRGAGLGTAAPEAAGRSKSNGSSSIGRRDAFGMRTVLPVMERDITPLPKIDPIMPCWALAEPQGAECT